MNCFVYAFRIAVVMTALSLPMTGHAAGSCWARAAQEYGVDVDLLKAIAWQESRGWTGAVGPALPDGNRALGLMQINTVHLERLAPYGIRREDLFDACTSQRIGAWVLADCIARFGAVWRSVGCYYAGPASTNYAAQSQYVAAVSRHYAGYRSASQSTAPRTLSAATTQEIPQP
jgi:soluble lytic murein transglycosylase-like protein